MIKENTINIKIYYQNINHYKSLGYNCAIGDLIDVLVTDLPKACKVRIVVECDYCGESFGRDYSNHINQTEKDIIKKDSCKKCKGRKTAESNFLIYGVSNIAQLDDTQKKMRDTLMERYGVEHQMHLKETKDKIKETHLERYGVEHQMFLQETKDKIKDTNQTRYGKDSYTQTKEYLERVKISNFEKYGVENVFQVDAIKEKQRITVQSIYGVDNVFQNEDIKIKSKATTLRLYGVEHIMFDEEIKNDVMRKQKETMTKNGNIRTSRQQIYLRDILDGDLNFLVDKVNLDIAYPNEKIYIEYNGSGHDLSVKLGKISYKQFKAKEMKRYFFLKSLGWKQIEINSPRDYLPSEIQIIDEIKKAKEWLNESDDKSHWHYIINLSNSVNDEKFGKLRII